VQTQRTRLQRALEKAKDDPEQQAKAHVDGVCSHAAAAASGDELAAKCRLEHLTKLHALVSFGSSTSGSSTSSSRKAAVPNFAFSDATVAAVAALRPALVLALLDEGALTDAVEALDRWTPRDDDDAAVSLRGSRAATPLLFSRALCDFVAWRGAPGNDAPPENGAAADDSDDVKTKEAAEATPLEQAANASLDAALAANVYVGVLLANLAIFVREIDPAIAAEAANAVPVVSDAEAAAAAAALAASCANGEAASMAAAAVGSSSSSSSQAAPSGPPSGAGSARERGGFAGSVEEALAYAAAAGGCWMDLLDKGCEEWAASRLAAFAYGGSDDEEDDEEEEEEEGEDKASGMGRVEWPPRRCSKAGARFVQLFVAAAEAAEAEASDDNEEDEGEGDDEILSKISEGDEAAASDLEAS
jgi:hypothetical protein